MAGPYDNQDQRRRPGVVGRGPAAGQVGVQGPHFEDLRPAESILQHPVPGYDYSAHPEYEKIRAGLQVRGIAQAGPAIPGLGTMGAAMSAASGPKPGVRRAEGATAQAASQNVGVPNAYAAQQDPSHAPTSLPEPGRSYPASQPFDIPAHWGQGYIEMNGQRMYAYSTPAQDQARREREAAYQRQRWDAERHQMIRNTLGDISGLVHGTPGLYGPMSEEARVGILQHLAPQVTAMVQADQAGHDAEVQFGNDPRRNPDLIGAQIANLRAETARHHAEADAADPMNKIRVLDEINRDPSRRGLAVVLGGGDAGQLGALPPVPVSGPGQPGINPGNVDQYRAQPQHAAMDQLFKDAREQSLDLADVIARAEIMPGFADRASPTRQMFDAWLKQQYAGHPEKWTQQFDGPPEPPSGGLEWYYKRGLGLLNQVGDPSTGWYWDHNYNQSRRRINAILKYHLNPFQP